MRWRGAVYRLEGRIETRKRTGNPPGARLPRRASFSGTNNPRLPGLTQLPRRDCALLQLKLRGDDPVADVIGQSRTI